MDKKQQRRFQSRLFRFANAYWAMKEKGGGDPEDIPEIEREYEEATEAIWEVVARLMDEAAGKTVTKLK